MEWNCPRECVREVVAPLKDRREQVNVAQGSPAQPRAAGNPNKDVRVVPVHVRR